MAAPLMMGGDLSDLGRNILAAFATESQANAAKDAAQNQLLAQIANSRLGQQQIAQRGQADRFNAMLQAAALRDAQDQRRQDFQNIMAQEAARNAARMAELERSIAGNKDIANIQNQRYGSNDPRLAIEQAREDAEIEEFNIAAENAASIANQMAAAAEMERDVAKKPTPGSWWGTNDRKPAEIDAADIAYEKAIAAIALNPNLDPSLIRFDPVSKRFIPAKRQRRGVPGQAAVRPSLPPDVQAALMAVAGAGPAMAGGGGPPAPIPPPAPVQTPNNPIFGFLRPSTAGTAAPSPSGPIVVQNGVRFQLGPNGWVPIQ